VQIQSNDPIRDTVVVDLIGSGLAPAIVLSHSNLTFGNIPVNSYSLQTLRIYNNGEAPLIIYSDSLKITGPDSDTFFIDTLTSDIVVTVGDSTEINVRFDAFETGTKQAELKIISNDPIQSQMIVTLSGSGIAPVISYSPINFDFGSLSVGSDSLQNLKIYNNGDAILIVYHDSLIISGSDSNAFIVGPVISDITVLPGDSAELDVHFFAFDPGQKHAELQLGCNDPITPSVTIPLSGEGIGPQIELSATNLDFNVVSELILTIPKSISN